MRIALDGDGLAGAPGGGIVLDPFSGAGTTGIVARQHGRRFIGIEISEAYVGMTLARWRLPIHSESVTVTSDSIAPERD